MRFLSPSTVDYSSQMPRSPSQLRITAAHHRTQMVVEGNDRFLSTAVLKSNCSRIKFSHISFESYKSF